MSEGLTASRFNMWRAVIAMMHADLVIKPHEINFILENTKNVSMTDEQRGVLANDLKQSVPIDEVFHRVTHPADKEDFFHLARALAWSDGDFDESEQVIINRLAKVSLNRGDEDVLQQSLKSFEEIYLDKTRAQGHDTAVSKMIRHWMAAN